MVTHQNSSSLLRPRISKSCDQCKARKVRCICMLINPGIIDPFTNLLLCQTIQILRVVRAALYVLLMQILYWNDSGALFYWLTAMNDRGVMLNATLAKQSANWDTRSRAHLKVKVGTARSFLHSTYAKKYVVQSELWRDSRSWRLWITKGALHQTGVITTPSTTAGSEETGSLGRRHRKLYVDHLLENPRVGGRQSQSGSLFKVRSWLDSEMSWKNAEVNIFENNRPMKNTVGSLYVSRLCGYDQALTFRQWQAQTSHSSQKAGSALCRTVLGMTGCARSWKG